MRTIDDEWDEYLNRAMPADAGEVQVRETRQAFLAGGMALIALLNSHSDEDGEKILEHALTAAQADLDTSLRRVRNRG